MHCSTGGGVALQLEAPGGGTQVISRSNSHTSVGCKLGTPVGARVGATVGTMLGGVVGDFDGMVEGSSVGLVVGN